MTADRHEHWQRLAHHSPLVLLLDLDGTIIPFAETPAEARPTPDVLALLRALVASPGLTVTLVSGRPRDVLDEVLAEIPAVRLVAEHGAWRKSRGAWVAAFDVDGAALSELAAELEPIVMATPGALLERKSASVCVHHRRIPRIAKDAFIHDVLAHMRAWTTLHPAFQMLDVIEAIEVRGREASKASAVRWAREEAGVGARLVAMGDDITDEEMFAALDGRDDPVLVGGPRQHRSTARWSLSGPEQVCAFLRALVDARDGEPLPEHVVPLPRVSPWSRPRSVETDGRSHRMLAISNRLPEIRETPRSDERRRNVGGLVSALTPALAERDGLWLGWSGQTIQGDRPGPVAIHAHASPRVACFDLPEAWEARYYNGFSNRALWPLFHGFIARAHFADEDWDAYVAANDAFADAATALVDRHAAIWVHDYHLLLLAAALRRRGHRGPLGLFLHIPFPSADLFETTPWAQTLLDAMLDFDLLGFHTPAYVSNFRETVARLSSARFGDDVIEHRGRTVRARAMPLGIYAEDFGSAPDPTVAAEIQALMSSLGASRLVLGVDRLDYTKGIPQRLAAFEWLLKRFPEWRGKVSLVQISVPSREDVPEYVEQRRVIENMVGRINGELGEAHWVPVRYLYRSYDRDHLMQLYRAAAVGYVTPLRDGMNLIAKELVAAQDPADPGVLVLSQFAGAAVEMRDALLTNPYHCEGMARDLDRALRMEHDERRRRHAALFEVVSRSTAVDWAAEFVKTLEACRRVDAPATVATQSATPRRELDQRLSDDASSGTAP